MADISQELEIINTATAGDDVREAIIAAIAKLNEEDLVSLRQLKEYLTTVTPLLNKFTVCPSGTLSISANGSYDVADYDMADVNIPEPSLPVEIANGERLSLPLVSSIGPSAFAYCGYVRLVTLNNAMQIGSEAFRNCATLSGINAPAVTSIGAKAFLGCLNLASVLMSNCSEIGDDAFYQCSSIKTISFPNATFIGSAAFRECEQLSSAYFLGSSVPVLANPIVFAQTPIQSDFYGYYGSIYVLPSMVEAFKAAEHWSNYSARITAYEGG